MGSRREEIQILAGLCFLKKGMRAVLSKKLVRKRSAR
jgi:hypothetical protein